MSSLANAARALEDQLRGRLFSTMTNEEMLSLERMYHTLKCTIDPAALGIQDPLPPMEEKVSSAIARLFRKSHT